MSAPQPDGTNPSLEQPELTINRSDGSQSVTQRFRGGFSSIETTAAGYSIGTNYTVGGLTLPLRSKRVERGVANQAVLTLDFGKDDQDSGGSSATQLSLTWQIKHTQTNVSIYRYCGQSAGASANRGRIEQWRRGQDAYLYANYQWRDKNGAINNLTARDKLLADKFMAGKENVMRFYPTIQKVERLTKGKVDNVGAGLLLLGFPTGAPATWEGDWEWMQIGDDLTYDVGAGTQTRTQTWLGSEGFDTDFYGAARWDWGSI